MTPVASEGSQGDRLGSGASRGRAWRQFGEVPLRCGMVRAVAIADEEMLAADDGIRSTLLDQLRALREDGRRLVLISGRRLGDLLGQNGPPLLEMEHFDAVVAENGAVVWYSEEGSITGLGAPVPERLVDALHEVSAVTTVHVGHAGISVATAAVPATTAVIDRLGLDMKVVSNRGLGMAVSSWVSGANGVRVALRGLEIPTAQALGIGKCGTDVDAMLACGTSVAVADADVALTAEVDYVTAASGAEGVLEVARTLSVSAAVAEEQMAR